MLLCECKFKRHFSESFLLSLMKPHQLNNDKKVNFFSRKGTVHAVCMNETAQRRVGMCDIKAVLLL